MAEFFIQGALAILGGSIAPPCIFHYFTGLPCPTCGTTRGIRALIHGDIISALSFNPLVIGGGILLFLYIAAGLIFKLKTGKFPEPQWTKKRIFILRIMIITTVAINWVYLIAAGI